jgi:Putative virion core protein (lumpy skin disease virus)
MIHIIIAELFLRAHGTYSIKIVNPLQIYAEAIPKNMDHVEITDIDEHGSVRVYRGINSLPSAKCQRMVQ